MNFFEMKKNKTDDFIADGKEYATNKRYNGKIIYRMCISGITSSTEGAYTTGIKVPTNAEVFMVWGTHKRVTGYYVTSYTSMSYRISPQGYLMYYTNDADNFNCPYMACVEYIKN